MSRLIRTGDNYAVLQEDVSDTSVDLIYLDPPYNSGRNYNITVEGNMAQEEAYEDTWYWEDGAKKTFAVLKAVNFKIYSVLEALYKAHGGTGQLAYLCNMSLRLLEMHRVLKTSGSLWLHCDPTASHYLKIILDIIFGPSRFQNEVIWRRVSAKSNATTSLPVLHDVLLVYAKGPKPVWNPEYFNQQKRLSDPGVFADFDGRLYTKDDLSNPVGHNNKTARPNLCYEFLGHTRTWRWTQERMQKAFDDGRIIQSKPGSVPRYKAYLDEKKGSMLGDIWNDIPPVQSSTFQGEKPVELLRRIIRLSTNPGDLVLDPFLGSGTTAIAAEMEERSWLGIELSPKTCHRARSRLAEMVGVDDRCEIQIRPVDDESTQELARTNPPRFEEHMVYLLNGTHTGKSGDGGVDGTLSILGFVSDETEDALIQVKAGSTSVGELRSFCHVIKEREAITGIFIALRERITKGMRDLAHRQGTYTTGIKGDTRQFPRLQIIAAEDVVAKETEALNVPGFVVRVDPELTPIGQQRHHRNMFDYAMSGEFENS